MPFIDPFQTETKTGSRLKIVHFVKFSNLAMTLDLINIFLNSARTILINSLCKFKF